MGDLLAYIDQVFLPVSESRERESIRRRVCMAFSGTYIMIKLIPGWSVREGTWTSLKRVVNTDGRVF